MGLVLIIIAVALCIGGVALYHAMTNAPEGNEEGSGFSFETNASKSRSVIRTESILEPASAAHIHRVTAA